MNELSNKSVAILIVIAIVISLGGTLISLNRLSRFGIPITGFATSGTGIANLTIITGTSIQVSGTIAFGPGVVNGSYALLESNATSYKSNSSGTWNWGALGYGGQAFIIQNDGNVNVSINVSANVTRASYVGGTNPLFGVAISWEENSAACSSHLGGVEVVSWGEINSTGNLTLCRNLTPTDTSDTINVSVRLVIPEDAVPSAAEKHALVTFYGYTGDDQ